MTGGEVGGPPRVSVVIPTKNRRADLLRAIESILVQTTTPAEVVVVDQSVDEKPRLAAEKALGARPEITVIYLRRADLSGLTAAKNVGVEASSGDVVLFIDDDVILLPDFLEELACAYGQSHFDGIGGVFEPDELRGRWHHRFALLFRIGPFRDDRLILQYKPWRRKGLHPTWLLSGGLSSCRAYVFDKVRFDEGLRGASPVEDVDFYSRASELFSFALAPRARAIHNFSKEVRLSVTDFYAARCQVFALYYQNYVRKTRSNHLAYVWLRVGLVADALVKAIRTRDRGPLIGIYRGWRAVAHGVREDQVLGAR